MRTNDKLYMKVFLVFLSALGTTPYVRKPVNEKRPSLLVALIDSKYPQSSFPLHALAQSTSTPFLEEIGGISIFFVLSQALKVVLHHTLAV